MGQDTFFRNNDFGSDTQVRKYSYKIKVVLIKSWPHKM